MMNDTKRKHTVKGFTLVEMVTVIAIIGILLGVLTPSLLTYYRNSRIKTANSDAKMVYNAVQTEVMKHMNMDRVRADAEKSGFDGSVCIGYQPASGNSFASGFSDIPNTLSGTAAAPDDKKVIAGYCDDIINSVNQTVSGASDVCWVVYVNNYIVKASVSASQSTSQYVGFYSSNKLQATDRQTTSYQNCFPALLTAAKKNYDGETSGTGNDT